MSEENDFLSQMDFSSFGIVSSKEKVIDLMKKFFEKKKYWAGGAIPIKKLLSEVNILTVMQVNILDGLDVAYECLSIQNPQNFNVEENGWEIKLCYGIISECHSMKIPKCHIAGILLVYLFLCQGINYIDELKKYNISLKGKYIFNL